VLCPLEGHLLIAASVRRIHEGIFARGRKLIQVLSQTLPSTVFARAKLRDLEVAGRTHVPTASIASSDAG
jgi:hypothetical protein